MAKAEKSLEATLSDLAKTGASPEAMLKEAQKVHPKASKKDIIRAAFRTMIETADHDPKAAKDLQDFALKARAE